MEDQFKILIWDNLVNAAFDALRAAFPFFNIPVIKQLAEFTIKKFADLLYKWTSEWIGFKKIALENLNALGEYQMASTKLKYAREIMTDSEYRKALQDEAKAFSSFIKFGVARG